MAGNANSGRHGYQHDIIAKEALKLSLSTIIKVLKDETLDIDLRLKAAIPIASKHFPDKIEFDEVKKLSYDEKMSILAQFKQLALLSGPVIS